MKIVQFTAQNVKRLKLVHITPKGNLVPITGRNGQGKTSVLDAIWWALGGKDNITSVPVRKGADTGTITLDLGQFVVERVFTTKKKCSACRGSGKVILDDPALAATAEPCDICAGSGFIAENGTEVTVRAPSAIEGKKGPKYDSPQAMLDALVGSLSFDPLEFARADSGEAFTILRQTVKVDFDFDAAAKADKEDREQRKTINGAAKQQRAFAASLNVPENLPAERIDEDALLTRMQYVYSKNAENQRQRESRTQAGNAIETDKISMGSIRDLIDRKHAEILELETKWEAQTASLDARKKLLEELPPVEADGNADEIRVELDAAKITNVALARRENVTRAITDAVKHEADSAAITTRMEERETAKQLAVQTAKMPVDGLGFGDGFVTLNGLPFEQASDAERLRVSIAIAMATNPKLRVIRIRDGSLLDEDSMKLIGEMAKAGDYQFWMERVQDNAPVGIVLEDGEVKADRQVKDETNGK